MLVHQPRYTTLLITVSAKQECVSYSFFPCKIRGHSSRFFFPNFVSCPSGNVSILVFLFPLFFSVSYSVPYLSRLFFFSFILKKSIFVSCFSFCLCFSSRCVSVSFFSRLYICSVSFLFASFCSFCPRQFFCLVLSEFLPY